ncbi:hypothetical protein MKY09_15860 [Psychrobacillus sp. FSL K6-4046]|uniref:hypothetical protein n=1 Tax=unclassified Psychrobacillus TaxID=2636677 RepID=UPI00203F81A4|nr:hypothetical protein [Psychrobacillus sp. MER TA 171]MCM3359517.1 hypothetical protein [Psychrobacillus sp. MER TA 171]
MFVIARNTNGVTEVLKNSNSQMVKVFYDYEEAERFVTRLNKSVLPNKHWSVIEDSSILKLNE